MSGSSGSGKSSLFRALAGLWPLGDGTIRLPQGAHVLALPQRPYFPLGTLRSALTYPKPADEVADVVIREAMAAVGLGHLAERLDEEAEWASALSGGEQQRVALARALIARPAVLLLDEAVTTLEDEDGRELYRVVAKRLPDTIIVSTGRPGALGAAAPARDRDDRDLGGRARQPRPGAGAGMSAEPNELQREPIVRMNFWDAKWDLDDAQCPCDIHFNDWVDAEKLTARPSITSAPARIT